MGSPPPRRRIGQLRGFRHEEVVPVVGGGAEAPGRPELDADARCHEHQTDGDQHDWRDPATETASRHEAEYHEADRVEVHHRGCDPPEAAEAGFHVTPAREELPPVLLAERPADPAGVCQPAQQVQGGGKLSGERNADSRAAAVRGRQ